MKYTITLGFKKLSNSLLLLFANLVVSIMKNNAVYVGEADQVEIVELASEAFTAAISAAGTGDYYKVKIMHQRRTDVETELTALARMLELKRVDDVTFYTAPGFDVRKKAVRNNMPLPKPILKPLKQGVISGSLDGEVTYLPDGVTQVAIRYSADGGTAWTNGTYSAGKRFQVSGLTPRNAYLVSASFHGSNRRMSDWSDPMGLFVL